MKCLADARSSEHKVTAQNPLERVQAEIQSRHHAEVAASAAKPPEEICVLVGAHVNHDSIRCDNLCSNNVVTGKAVLRSQVAEASAKVSPATPVEPTTPPGVTRPKI